MQRPDTVEQSSTLRPRASSLAETSPYRRATTAGDDTELAPTEFGPYLVYEQLGEGGMAHVHRAELVAESGLRKQVALKRLNTEASEDPALVASFVHEAQLAAKLHHPNIAQAYDLGKIDNTYYIAMELVPGPTLAQIMTQVRNGAGAVPLPIALEILIQLADALDHIHNQVDDSGRSLDLIHRDVSPANIIISRTGAAKLIDFGIAKARTARLPTEAGIIKGKHGYIAPEYTYGQLDHRADLFALGVVAHELLTGRRLFLGANDLATLANIRHLPIPPPSRFAPALSANLDTIVLTALEREPEKRWQAAGAMRVALVEEARRLGAVISGPQIRDWVEWAFHQTARRESSVDRMLERLDSTFSVVIEVEETVVEPKIEPKVVVRAPTPAATSGSGPIAPDPASSPDEPLVLSDARTKCTPSAEIRSDLIKRRVESERAPTPPPLPDPPPAPVKRSAVAKRPRRMPAWRAPTRWISPPHQRGGGSVVVLLSLVAFAFLAVDQGWIDIVRWQQILGI